MTLNSLFDSNRWHIHSVASFYLFFIFTPHKRTLIIGTMFLPSSCMHLHDQNDSITVCKVRGDKGNIMQ